MYTHIMHVHNLAGRLPSFFLVPNPSTEVNLVNENVLVRSMKCTVHCVCTACFFRVRVVQILYVSFLHPILGNEERFV